MRVVAGVKEVLMSNSHGTLWIGLDCLHTYGNDSFADGCVLVGFDGKFTRLGFL